MDNEHDDYAEPAREGLCRVWLRELAAVFLLLALVETDLVMRAWLDSISVSPTYVEVLSDGDW